VDGRAAPGDGVVEKAEGDVEVVEGEVELLLEEELELEFGKPAALVEVAEKMPGVAAPVELA
jgi:hypothetical protein